MLSWSRTTKSKQQNAFMYVILLFSHQPCRNGIRAILEMRKPKHRVSALLKVTHREMDPLVLEAVPSFL